MGDWGCQKGQLCVWTLVQKGMLTSVRSHRFPQLLDAVQRRNVFITVIQRIICHIQGTFQR